MDKDKLTKKQRKKIERIFSLALDSKNIIYFSFLNECNMLVIEVKLSDKRYSKKYIIYFNIHSKATINNKLKEILEILEEEERSC